MSSQTSTSASNNFHEMIADGPYCMEVQNILSNVMGAHVSVFGYSSGILRVDDGAGTFHVVCVDEVQPTREELAGERFGIERDRVFYFRSPYVVACDVISKRDERKDQKAELNHHLQNNIEVQLPSYSLPVQVKGYF